jgi:hypothetical protein
MNYAELMEMLGEIAKKYKEDEFTLYCAEIGWDADWMSEHTTAKYGEEMTEKETNDIINVLADAWNRIFY